MNQATVGRWFPHATRAIEPALRVFCLPHGGAGASTFAPWTAIAAAEIEVVPVQLPGREGRFREPPARSIGAVCDDLLEPIQVRASGSPYVLFGHSMGALIAYELGRLLAGSDHPPVGLAVSGAAAPHRPVVFDDVSHLDDGQFLAHVARLGGTSADILADPDWLDVILPTLRADFQACESYRHEVRASQIRPLSVPISVFGGTDDPSVPVGELARWQDLTTIPVTVRVLPGHHFFVTGHARSILTEVAGNVRPEAGS